jgi:hypothetical protein
MLWFAEVLELAYHENGRARRYIRSKIGPFDNERAGVDALIHTLEKFRSAGIDTPRLHGACYMEGRRENSLCTLSTPDEYAPINP